MNLHRRRLEDAIEQDIRRQKAQGSNKNAFGHYWELINGVLVGGAGVALVVADAAAGVIPNALPTESLNDCLNTWVGGTAKAAGTYLALYAGAINPAAGWTAANVAATATEISSGTEGYTQTTRPQWTPNAAAGGIIDSVGAESVFTIATATELLVEGVFAITNNVKGGTSGALRSAARYPLTRHLQNADDYRLGFRITLTG